MEFNQVNLNQGDVNNLIPPKEVIEGIGILLDLVPDEFQDYARQEDRDRVKAVGVWWQAVGRSQGGSK